MKLLQPFLKALGFSDRENLTILLLKGHWLHHILLKITFDIAIHIPRCFGVFVITFVKYLTIYLLEEQMAGGVWERQIYYTLKHYLVYILFGRS